MAIRFLLLLVALSGADSSRIVGGRDAPSHSHPYMASVVGRNGHTCGGALIREDFVVTAAHCGEARPLRVVLGIDSLQGNETTRQNLGVLSYIPHPNHREFLNDIMLLKLSDRAQLTEAVKLISLKCGKLKPQSKCITAGWGFLKDNGELADRLKELNVTTLSKRACQRRWGSRLTIDKTMVCAVGARRMQGVCSGDWGGPLVCDGAMAGVVNFSGEQCGQPGTPDIYARISCFAKWIKKVLKKNLTNFNDER